MKFNATLAAALLASAPAAAQPTIDSRFAQIAKDPLELRLFLRAMPKGGDLHNHLSGAIWAEDFILWAKQAGFCTSADGRALVPPPAEGCAGGHTLAFAGGDDNSATNRLIDAMSTRGWQSGQGRDHTSGHDQFFGTFDAFGAITRGHAGQMLAALRQQAALDRLTYLEVDHNTDTLARLTAQAPKAPVTDLAAAYASEIAILAPHIAAARQDLTQSEAQARQILACDQPNPPPACAITVHYLFQALRALPQAKVFRSLILGFAMADADPRYVGVNIVMPEDAPLALEDYDLHMAMIAFLAQKYPHVALSLHAGELVPGLVPPRDLTDHIAKAIATGARRIGHGVDIAYEENAEKTLQTMAKNHIAVEINLTSNAVILGVAGRDHPVNLYRRRGVPIALSTDDQGVLRTDMTAQYVQAVREQGFTYADLKQSARNSLEYAFVPGQSLWLAHDYTRPNPARAHLLATSEKARLQADLESRLSRFERDQIAMVAAKSPPKSQ